jgi:hypothetical protein
LTALEHLALFSILAAFPLSTVGQSPAGRSSEDDARQAVAEAQNKDVQAREVGNVPKILTILVSKTRFSGRVNLNGNLDDLALNVYVLAPHLRQRKNVPDAFFRVGIFGNCAYVGVSNTIICDSDFLSMFLKDHGIDGDWSDKSQRELGWTFQDAFLAWILGHELGHVVRGGPAAHFGQENVLDKATDASIELSQKRETEADLFAAKRIEADKKLTTTLERLLIDLINQEIERKNGKSPAYGVGLNWDYADKSVIAYFTKQDHPEYVVRATRILTALAADTHEEGLQALLESFTRHLAPRNDTPH